MSDQVTQDKIRNVAIIAHVDHGKTSLVDAFLKQTKVFRDNQEEMTQDMILDTGDLEREKGITIKAKNIAIKYKGHKINIIDTPGHADFGGEVERTLHMADGCILLVDAQEGPMPQTKFVLKKALELGLDPMVVINKIDKQFSQPAKTLDKLNDLFLDLATKDSQLDFPVYYAVGREGFAYKELPSSEDFEKGLTGTIEPLLDGILDHIPSPDGDPNGPFQMLITTLHYDAHMGKYLIGKINRGKIKIGDPLVVAEKSGDKIIKVTGRAKKIMLRNGLDFEEVSEVSTGDIIAIGGIDSKAIGATICDPEHIDIMKTITITNPSIKIKFEANTSPFAGREGEFVTARLLEARLEKEIETNISLQIEKADGGGYYVSGRGELQLSILIEELRREGYEFQIKKPEIVLEKREDGLYEPKEEVFIEVPLEYQGTIVAELSERQAELVNIEQDDSANLVRLQYNMLTRDLIGLRSILLTLVKGNLVMNNMLIGYEKYVKRPERYRKGVIISSETGVTTEYSLNTIQERGQLFVKEAVDVYEGMIIGINKYDTDMDVNPIKERAKSAVRRNAAEVTHVMLKSIIPLTIDFAIVFLGKDELLEITPKSLRLRKIFLNQKLRVREGRKNG